jgi:hypothetical protein
VALFRIGPVARDNGSSAWGLYRELPLLPLELLAEFPTKTKAQTFADRLSELERRKRTCNGKQMPVR